MNNFVYQYLAIGTLKERHFELCSKGRWLRITLGFPLKTKLTRDICNKMNELAREITQGSQLWIKNEKGRIEVSHGLVRFQRIGELRAYK